jgi:hypothetical protein
MGTVEFQPIETAWIDGPIAFRKHGGGPGAATNWPTFLAIAEDCRGHSPHSGK